MLMLRVASREHGTHVKLKVFTDETRTTVRTAT